MTGTKKNEQKQAGIFGLMPINEIFNPFPPYSLRNDCQVGQWKRGEDEFKGSSIEISLIKARKFYGELGISRAHWIQLWFVPSPKEEKLPPNTVCVTYAKTRSLDSLSGQLIELMTNGKDPGNMIFSASFEKHIGQLGNYYSVKWEPRDRADEEERKQLEKIQNFVWSNPQLIDPSLPKTMICTDGMSPEEIETLEATIDAIKNAEVEQKKLGN